MLMDIAEVGGERVSPGSLAHGSHCRLLNSILECIGIRSEFEHRDVAHWGPLVNAVRTLWRSQATDVSALRVTARSRRRDDGKPTFM